MDRALNETKGNRVKIIGQQEGYDYNFSFFSPRLVIGRKLLIFIIAIWVTFLHAATLDENILKTWLSRTNFYSYIELEISQNQFLDQKDSRFTEEPSEENVRIEGALLPNSYYINIGTNAFGKPLIYGESNDRFWCIGGFENTVAFAYKDPKNGGDKTNTIARVATTFRESLRGWTQLGLVHIAAETLRINGQNFTASHWNDAAIKGRFTSIGPLGQPLGMTYEVSKPYNLRVESKIASLDLAAPKYEALIGIWLNDSFLKRFRIRVVKIINASETDSKRIFNPSDFLTTNAVIGQMIIQSNGIRYAKLPSGQLRPFPEDIPKERASKEWTWIVAVALLVSAGLWAAMNIRKSKQTQ